MRPVALPSIVRLLIAVLLIALPSGSRAASDQEASRQARTGRKTWIEQVSPAAFARSDDEALARYEVRYQVNATVLIPLFVASIPLLTREDVGVGSFAVIDLADGDGEPLRAYEFFAASIPERARGLNRLGFIREVAKMDAGGAQWTAQFGVISADRAESREDAEQSFEQNQNLQPYRIIDAMIESQRTVDTVTGLTVEGLWKSAAELYADVRPLWGATSPETSHELDNPRHDQYDQPVGFLGAIQHTLRHVATALAEGREPEPLSYPFIHKSEVFQMEFRDHHLDRRRQRRFARAGLVTPDAVVHRLDYRVMNDRGDEEESFELWTELPVANASDPLSPPMLPLAFEFKPRSYLELKAVQVPPDRRDQPGRRSQH
jgi:hypothetical protein